MAKKLISDIERFWTHVEHQENGCWHWTAAIVGGYGYFKIWPKMTQAHRFIFEQLYGPIPDGLELHHVCENRRCVNPEHLELLTRKAHVSKSPNNITYIHLHQTHCHRGHEFTPENTYTHRGKRYCQECQRLNQKNYEARRKAK